MAKQKPITVGKGTSYTRPVTPGRSPRPVSAKPSAASKVRAAQKTTSSGITKRPDGRAQTEGRKARQSTSTARVTQSGGGTSNSAKVTTGRGTLQAAQKQGQQIRQAAQVRRGARGAMKAMEGTLKAARTARNIAGAAKNLAKGGLAATVLQARNTAPGTITAAQSGRAPSRFGNARDLAMKKAKAIKGSPVVGTGSFNSTFTAARKAGKSTFTWRGKKYTTEKK